MLRDLVGLQRLQSPPLVSPLEKLNRELAFGFPPGPGPLDEDTWICMQMARGARFDPESTRQAFSALLHQSKLWSRQTQPASRR